MFKFQALFEDISDKIILKAIITLQASFISMLFLKNRCLH
jgi:hypothetical protein